MTPGSDALPRPRALSVLGMVACLGTVFLGGWLSWCGVLQFAGIATEAEIISTRTEQRTRKGRKYADTYGVVRYADQTDQAHTDELQLYGETAVGRKIPVRYLPWRPGDCRHDDFWGIWGLAVMVSGTFALIVGLTWYVERKRGTARARRNPFDRTSP